ncbi:MAG: CheR family methyltransferase, partial [Desulfurivibrio sp.]
MASELNNISQFKELLLKACGHKFTDEREQSLVEALNQRMNQRKIKGAERYYLLLLSDREELQRLIELLTVNETYFFREPEYLRLVVDRIVPELLENRRDQPVRIVCAGCATGEEPYSLAMLLDQRFGAESRRRFLIAAADIDATAIAAARRGIYGPGSFRGDFLPFRQRYFTPLAQDSWQLNEIRRQ